MANTVYNPATPYVGPIPGGVYDGMEIHVSGVPEHHHTGFLIALQAGGSLDPRSDCAFVFNPRFTDNQVIRNTLQGGNWGAEERHGGFPFQKGQHCDITIYVKPSHYAVHVNGIHHSDYHHRMPKHRVSHITVEQGLRIQQIRFGSDHGAGHRGHKHQHGGGIGAVIGQVAGAVLSEMFSPANQPYGPGYPQPGPAPVYNPPVPYVQNIGGLRTNMMIFISGIPNPYPSRFTVYLQQGHHHEPHEIAMCVDARFSYSNDFNTVVRNHKQGAWGSEERHVPYFPFSPNVNFEMVILVEPHAFKVAVNNQHLLEFRHRIQPMHRIDTLRIDGDVRLNQVRIQG